MAAAGPPAGDAAVLKGTPLSPGLGRGHAVVLARGGCRPAATALSRRGAAAEVARFREACESAAAELAAVRETHGAAGGLAAEILQAQELLLRDRHFVERVARRIRDGGLAAEGAVAEVVGELSGSLGSAADPYLRERGADLRDVGHRLQRVLAGDGGELDLPPGAVLVVDEVTPSLVASLDPERVRGVVSAVGARVSHAAILLRSLGIPAVGGVGEGAGAVESGAEVLVDGISGHVFVEPPRHVVAEYERLAADLAAHDALLARESALPAVTRDGVAVRLLANLGKAADTAAAMRWNAEGVGLYRTEFSFDVRDRFPTEDEQAAVLCGVAERLGGRPVVFRLLDLGAEKSLPYFPLPAVANPALHLRGTRLLLAHPEVLRCQLRAILRTAARHPAAVLLPMVGGLEEVRAVREVLAGARAELLAAGVPVGTALPVGAMIEVPSAALMAEDLAREVDFLSVGTNDLVQYLLAADRDEPAMAPWYRMLHPAVLRLLAGVLAAAARSGTEVTVCGEMAGDPLFTELLLGLGVRSVSVAPRQLGAVRHEVRRCDTGDAAAVAAELLRMGTRAEVRAAVESRRAQADVALAGEPD